MSNTIDALTLKKAFIAGANNLDKNKEYINELNVFPVPDGDTGTNMTLTILSAVREVEAAPDDMKSIAKAMSTGSLRGARGNSGVILSQLLRGFSKKVQDSRSIDVHDIADAFQKAVETAYKAVMKPKEGTILTVAKGVATKARECADADMSLEQFCDEVIEYGDAVLDSTPEMLPVLKEAGVVDSGGQGLLEVFRGAFDGYLGKEIDYSAFEKVSSGPAVTRISQQAEADIKFGYCTEFIIELKNDANFQESDLRSPLSMMGDSLVLVHDDGLVKVHVHVNKPGQVLELAQNFGEFVKIKVENMRLQHSELINAKPEETKPQEKKKFALVAVCFGDGIKQTFTDLGVDYIIDGGQTMNPSTEEFVKAVKACNAENIIIIPNNGNVILSAEQSTKLCDDANIRVLKAKTIAQGYASLMAFDSSNDLDTNYEDMTEAISNVQTGEVTYAVRDTEIKGVKIKAGDYMGICNGEIVVSVKERLDATKILLDKCVNEDSSIVTIFRGVGTPDEEIEELKEHCTELNEDVEVEVIDGNQDIYSYIIAVEA